VNSDYVKALRGSIPVDVRELCHRLRESGFRAWVVGGCVRDHVMDAMREQSGGAESVRNDWDVATNARPEEVMKLFRRVIPTGIKHGTVTVLFGEDSYEVTTLRGETTYSDGRRPDSVFFVDDIVADLARRDFTINAMAYDPLEDSLIDPFDAIDDLRDGVLRAVGNPAARFAEDGLRVLRAARFAATLEVQIEPATARAIEPSLASYAKVSPERIREEWMKAMKARAPSRAFAVMKDHGMLAITAPEMLESVGCEQNRFHAYDVWDHAMACLDGCPPGPVLRVAGLLHDIGKPRSRAFSEKTSDYTFYEHERIGAEMVEPLLSRLRFSNDERVRIVGLVRHHLVCYDESWSDAAVRRWIKRVSPELLEDLYALNRADVLGKGRDASDDVARLEALKARVASMMAQGVAMTVRELRVNGNDLMKALGNAPGPWLGRVLALLLDEVIENPELNDRDYLIGRARQLMLGDEGGGEGK
jgi:tRNA nucleotidyltransferase (CCA-adding enzyme)